MTSKAHLHYSCFFPSLFLFSLSLSDVQNSTVRCWSCRKLLSFLHLGKEEKQRFTSSVVASLLPYCKLCSPVELHCPYLFSFFFSPFTSYTALKKKRPFLIVLCVVVLFRSALSCLVIVRSLLFIFLFLFLPAA